MKWVMKEEKKLWPVQWKSEWIQHSQQYFTFIRSLSGQRALMLMSSDIFFVLVIIKVTGRWVQMKHNNPFNRLSAFSWIILMYVYISMNGRTFCSRKPNGKTKFLHGAHEMWAGCAFNLSMVLVADKVLIHHRHAMWHAHTHTHTKSDASKWRLSYL